MLQQVQEEAPFCQTRSIMHAIIGHGNHLAMELCILYDDELVGGRHTCKTELLMGEDIIKLLPLNVLGQFKNRVDIITLNIGSTASIPHILVADAHLRWNCLRGAHALPYHQNSCMPKCIAVPMKHPG